MWESQNFARPGGADKFSFDETKVYCAANASGSGQGSTWNITDYQTNIPPDGTDFSGIWGGPVVDGFYNVASYSGGILTLGAKVYDVPSDWASASGDTGTCFGKLRFPDAPSILGRAAVDFDPSFPLSLTFPAAQTAFGMHVSATEQIDIWDKDMNLLAGNVTATIINSAEFAIAVSQPKAAFITITGAPKWYMNDTDPKGDFLKLEWTSDNRSPGEASRLAPVTDCDGNPVAAPAKNAGGGPVSNPYASFTQTPGCVPFSPCAPKVVCITPNGEHFPNGVTYPFPAGFQADEKYGSKWWGWINVTMTDLLWQAPHAPCGFVDLADAIDLNWSQDNGTCLADFDSDNDGGGTTHNKFYAFPPQVEARASVPCNYGKAQNECGPALPAGIQIGWSSPVTAVSGDIAFPPTPPSPQLDGTPNGTTTAYALHALLCDTASKGCRFNYSLPGC